MIQVKNKYREVIYEYFELDELELDYVSETCAWCDKEMIDIRYIYTDLESGNYCCKNCKDEYGLDAVECKEL
jgi:predicted SprT family Zn-dependent metalloprotease